MAKLRNRISRARGLASFLGLAAFGFLCGCGGNAPASGVGEFKQPTTTMPSELKPDNQLSQPPKLKPPD